MSDTDTDTDATKQKIAALILELYPSATRYGVESSDQNQGYGYLLSDVGFDDTTITRDSGTFTALAERIDDELLLDLDWGAFGDRNADAAFDVDITTGRIMR